MLKAVLTVLVLSACNSSAFDGLTEARLRQGDTEILITIDDANEIHTALIEALKSSELNDREELIDSTESAPAWIDSDERISIGGWLLQIRSGGMVATYRISQDKARAFGYAASVIKDENHWRITQILPEEIMFRP